MRLLHRLSKFLEKDEARKCMTGQSADFERQNLPNHPIDIGSFRFAETSEASTQRALQPSFPSGHYCFILAIIEIDLKSYKYITLPSLLTLFILMPSTSSQQSASDSMVC